MFKILVVEDDRELNRTVCAYLNRNGFEAVGCLDVNAAYDEMYGGTVFDLIISDIMMPDIDGFEFARTVRELNTDIPLLFVTARDDFAAKLREERSAVLDGREIPLTVREFNLLYKLLSYPKKTFTRAQLMDEFWDADSTSGPRAVDVYMTKLREKFADCKDFEIVTVHGLGYKAVLHE